MHVSLLSLRFPAPARELLLVRYLSDAPTLPELDRRIPLRRLWSACVHEQTRAVAYLVEPGTRTLAEAARDDALDQATLIDAARSIGEAWGGSDVLPVLRPELVVEAMPVSVAVAIAWLPGSIERELPPVATPRLH